MLRSLSLKCPPIIFAIFSLWPNLDGTDDLLADGSCGIMGNFFPNGGKVRTNYKSLFENTCV